MIYQIFVINIIVKAIPIYIKIANTEIKGKRNCNTKPHHVCNSSLVEDVDVDILTTAATT